MCSNQMNVALVHSEMKMVTLHSLAMTTCVSLTALVSSTQVHMYTKDIIYNGNVSELICINVWSCSCLLHLHHFSTVKCDHGCSQRTKATVFIIDKEVYFVTIDNLRDMNHFIRHIWHW